MKRGQKLTNPKGRRNTALIERAMRRQPNGARRTISIAVRLSEGELAQVDELRSMMGMSRSQLLRYLILKAIAIETGVRRHHWGKRSGTTHTEEGERASV